MEKILNKTYRELVKETLLCPVCLEVVKNPVSLPCSHTFCQHCILQVKESSTKCPYCRKEYSVELELHVNTFLAGLVDSLALHDKLERCEEHQKKLSLFCVTCIKLVCTHCATFTHERTHEFRSLKEFLELIEEKKQNHIKFFQAQKRKYSDRVSS